MLTMYESHGVKIAVLTSEYKFAEYTAVSVIKDRLGTLLFAQLIGEESPLPILGSNLYAMTVSKVNDKQNIYTVWHKKAFDYRMPLDEHEPRLIIAPTTKGAEKILEQLVGISDWNFINRHFDIEEVEDNGVGKLKGILVKQKYSAFRDRNNNDPFELLDEFNAAPRRPILYGEGGANEFAI